MTRTLRLSKQFWILHRLELDGQTPLMMGTFGFCRNGSSGSNNGNLNGDGPLYIAPAVAYSGSGNNNGEDVLQLPCALAKYKMGPICQCIQGVM